MKSTAGARFFARDRDIAEGRIVAVETPPGENSPKRGPLIERLPLSSLCEIGRYFGWTLAEMAKRYEDLGMQYRRLGKV